MAKRSNDWFKVREELTSLQRGVLTTASFLLPFLVWSFFAYFPGIWNVSFDVTTTTDIKSEQFPTIYRVGHTMEDERFKEFQEIVRTKNSEILAYQNSETDELPQGIRSSSRSNKKVLRKLFPLALEKEVLKEDQSTDDAALFALWKNLAEGTTQFKELDSENMEIVRKNWAFLLAASGDTYKSKLFPKEPLLHIIPVGKKAIGRPSYLPAPHEVWNSWQKLIDKEDDSFWARYWASIGIVFCGFAIACLVGLPIGLLAGTFDFFSRLFEPFIDFFRYLPAPAFGTLLIFLLGSHDAPKIALVFLGTVCQAILMSANTSRQLDKSILDAAQTLGAGKRALVLKVVIPGIMQNLYNDLRILLGWSWTWLVIAELMGVKSGLTEVIDTQGRRFNFDIVYAVILSIGVTGFFTDQVLSRLYPSFFPWTVKEGDHFFRKLLRRLIPTKA